MTTVRICQRKNGSLAYLSEVRVKRDGKIIHRESGNFDRQTQAKAWADSREKKFAKKIPAPKRSLKLTQATLRKVFEKYREDVSDVRPMGRSKASNIRFLEKCEIAKMTACEIKSSDITTHVRSRRRSGAGPSTANNDIVWLRVILAPMRPRPIIPICVIVSELY